MAIELAIHFKGLVIELAGLFSGIPAYAWPWAGCVVLLLGAILYLALDPDDS